MDIWFHLPNDHCYCSFVLIILFFKRLTLSFILSSSLVISFEWFFLCKSSSSNVCHFDETFAVIPFFLFFFEWMLSRCSLLFLPFFSSPNEHHQDVHCRSFLSFLLQMNVINMFIVVPSFPFFFKWISSRCLLLFLPFFSSLNEHHQDVLLCSLFFIFSKGSASNRAFIIIIIIIIIII